MVVPASRGQSVGCQLNNAVTFVSGGGGELRPAFATVTGGRSPLTGRPGEWPVVEYTDP
jgi:hypothetical protein